MRPASLLVALPATLAFWACTGDEEQRQGVRDPCETGACAGAPAGGSHAGGMSSSAGARNSLSGGSPGVGGGGGGEPTSGGGASPRGPGGGGGMAEGGAEPNAGGVSTGAGGSGDPGAGGTATGGSGTGGTIGSGGSPPVTFRNPLNASHGSDPWLAYYEGNYYLAATTWGTTLTMKRGATIQALKDAQPTVIWDDSTGSRCCNNWAPEFFLLDGPNGRRWYLYYTAGDGNTLDSQRSHVLESDGLDPMGPYHYQGRLLDYWAIDGSVLEVGNARYFMFSSWSGGTQNVYAVAMSSPWTVTGNRVELTRPEHAWEREGSDSVNEAPEPLYHEGRTFVTYSASQCADPGYKLGLLELTASDPLNPSSWWKSTTPVFQAANAAYGSAHNGFFTSPDGTEDWLVYHATTNPNGSCWTDRTTRVQPFTWNDDGTPDFGQPLHLDTEIVVPSGESP